MKTKFIIHLAMLLSVAFTAELHAQLVADGGTLNFTGTTNLPGDLIVGTNGGNTLLDILAPGTVTNATGTIGLNATSTNNQVHVENSGAVWQNNGNLLVGNNSAGNQLVLSNGGMVQAANAFVGAGATASDNVLAVDGSNSTITMTSPGNVLRIGNDSTGNQLRVTGGGLAGDHYGVLGYTTNASGNSALVSGPGSIWSNEILYVGESGSGNLLVVSNGGVVTDNTGTLGGNLGSDNNLAMVTGTNSLWSTTSYLRVGQFGTGNQLVVTNGGTVTSGDGFVGADNAYSGVPNVAVVTGTGSVWSNTANLYVSYAGSGNQLVVSDGGTVQAVNATVGLSDSSINNRTTIDGGNLIVTGTLDIRRGTNVLNAGLIQTDNLLLNNSAGFFNFNGGTLSVGDSTVDNSAPLVVGNGSLPAMLDLEGNGFHTFTHGLVISNAATLKGNGTVTGLVTVATGGVISPGGDFGQTGTFTVHGSVTNHGTYSCEVDNVVADRLVVANNLNLTGSSLDLQFLESPTAKRYIIATYGTLTGTFATISNLPSGYKLDYAYDEFFSFNIALVKLEAPPLLHWPLEEGSGTNTTEAVSGATNVAFLSGPAAWTGGIAPGSAYGVSVDIDTPASYVDAGTLTTNGNYVAGSDPGFRVLQNNWSITAWVRLNNPQSAATDRVIASSDWDSTDGWLFFAWNDAGVHENLAFDFGSDRQSSGLSLPLDQTVFVAITADTSGASFPGGTNKHQFAIWDGNSWQTTNGTQFINLRLQGLELGSFNTGTRQFDGVIDDVRIFDRTLTQTELALLASQRPALAIAPAGAGSNTVSWTPDLPGYVLQETPSLAPASWTNSPSGAANPIDVPADVSAKFYRLFKP